MNHVDRRPSLLVISLIGSSHHGGRASHTHANHTSLFLRRTLHELAEAHRRFLLLNRYFKFFLLSNVALVAKSPLPVSLELLEWVSLLASVGALEHQVLEDLFHNLVWRVEYGYLIANTAHEFVLVRVALARSLGEIGDALATTPS